MTLPPPSNLPVQGDVIAGKYRVDRVLGAGGMGVVVAAHHVQLDERVALKFLLPQAMDNPEAVSRFVREARAAVKIKNEHVARVSDVGTLENGSPYMVMEYLEGSDLAGWLAQRGPLPLEQAVDFVLQACEALAEAHTLGIVHRDLKPANLFCVQLPNGNLSVKVLDFGISKIVTPGAPGHDMTKTTAVMGSPLYMSPEQLQRSKGVDSRTDIWALGVILFELVTGKAPFDADAVTELILKIAMEPAPLVRSLRSDLPEPLEAVLTTCLSKNRETRFQTVGDLAIALQPFGSPAARISVDGILGTLRKAGIATGSVPPAPLSGVAQAVPHPTSGAMPAQTDAAWGQTNSESRSGSKTLAGAAIAVTMAIALGLGGFLLWRNGATPTAAGQPEPAVSASSPASSGSTAQAAATAPPSVAAPSVAAAVSNASAAVAPSAPPHVAHTVKTPAASHGAPSSASPPTTTAAPVAEPAAAPASNAKNNCDPPYYYDAKRARVYKPECL